MHALDFCLNLIVPFHVFPPSPPSIPFNYVDALLSEFRLLLQRLNHLGIPVQVQHQLVQFAMEAVADVLVEGFSRVKRCSNEGRALMSLDLQTLINGLQQLTGRRPDMQIVDTYIKAFYLPETEYLYWALSHPEYSRAQVVSLINLVAVMKGWRRKTRVGLIDRIEGQEIR
ncbi:unnamed protein product [Closterium sp. NIES-54]